jgi:RHS repeat-associated protein
VTAKGSSSTLAACANGRIQDAITGRFLSADSNIPNPGNTQSFNRYCYVNNNPLTLIDPSGFDEEQGCDGCGGGGEGGDVGGGEIDPGSVGFSPGSAPPSASGPSPTTQTGSMIPGVATGASCYGNCVGQYANSIQVLNSYAPETVSVNNANGSTSSYIEDADAGQAPTMEVDAPGYHWVSTGILDQGFNFAPFASAATQISMGRALGQFAAIGAGRGTAIGALYAGIAGTPAAVAALQESARARFVAQMLAKGVDAAYGDLRNQLAEQEIIGEAQTSFMESLESLSGISTATEIATPEVTGPILPWGP